MSEAIEAQGTLLEIGTTAADAASDTYIAVAEVVDFNGPGGSAQVIDATHLQSVAKEKKKGLPDSGQFTCNVNRIFSNAGQQRALVAWKSNDAYNFRVTYPDSTVHRFKGFVMQFPTQGGVDQLIKGSVTIEITGEVEEL